MFRKISYMLVAAIMAFMLVPMMVPVQAAVEVGKPAPQFKATDIAGNEVDLAALKGKTVVLEWTNHMCPFVIKHYDSGNMQATQKKATDAGAVWISIVSSGEGMQGHTTLEEAAGIVKKHGAHPTHKILDASGEIGKLYDAKTTPHMFVINPEGNIVYAGAIDDQPSPRMSSVEGATNYVLAALDSIAAGEPVKVPSSAPYGCAVKYAY